jgi:Zn-finger nucleic acid-binding protein
MKKLSIAIDMGAKNNGVFIVKSDNNKVLNKKATNIIVDTINFSKKSRRENRHKDRNYKRRKLAKRLLKEIIDFSKYDEKQQEQISGLLNNRGYTFISTSTEFEKLNDETIKFIDEHFDELKALSTKEDFENKVSSFESLDELKEYIKIVNGKITLETKKKKAEFYKEFQVSFASFIKKDLIEIRKLFSDILKELDTGSKPRAKYFEEIKLEIEKELDFIHDFSKEQFYNLIGNISNFQLRVLRKYFNNKFDDSLDLEKLDLKVRRYFKAFHYKSEKEKNQRKQLFEILGSKTNILEFLKTTDPNLTIPPYEDMNNRDTYKCNSMFIKPNEIDDDIKEAIDFLLSKPEFSNLLITNKEGVFEKESLEKVKITTRNKQIKEDFTYSKYLQRILDTTPEITSKELNPRNVFKHKAKFDKGSLDSIECFKRVFGEKTYNSLKDIAQKYYQEEEKILSGIYEESNSILVKCNTNTPYKNNAKHILLKPIYSYNFTSEESDKLIEDIKDTKGLQTALQRVSDEAKKYQNSFYHIVEACYKNEKCIDDKDIKLIVKNIDKNFLELKNILKDKNTYLQDIVCVDEKNFKRVINIFKQTYEILFKELGGFNKTCKCCTIENAIRSDKKLTIRSDEKLTIAKRLLSDVAKPIDGMLDMMLDRLAYEISENITQDDIKDCENFEILLEQNKFEFEESLNTIKRANNPQIKKFDKDKYKDKLNVNICPYSGQTFDKGDFDHILPQSKGVYNSKANMIYASVEGNQKIKGNRDFTLEMLALKHLEAVFGKDKSIEDIKKIIKSGVESIDTNSFTNFNNLKLQQQIALRYGLFMRDTDEFKKAFEIVKKDKIKTFSNGTQKRLARFIYEKLALKFQNEFKTITINSKVVDNQLVSSTRKSLAVNPTTGEINQLFKEEIQNSHSHCIDAMVVFYLANSEVKNKNSYKDTILEPAYSFDDIYLDESGINNLSKKKTFINSPTKELGSYKLFDETIYSEHYKHITKESIKNADLETLIRYGLVFINEKSKKVFIDDIDRMEEKTIYKLDVQKVSNTVYKLFKEKKELELKSLKVLDSLIYFTSRKEIETIFFDDKATKLLEFEKLKNIPYFSKNLYKAVYKKLQNETKLFNISEDGKATLNSEVLNNLLIDMFASKQKAQNKEQRKRDRKRHKYTLPILGSPKFRIKRANNTWQVLGNKDIATKNYMINGNIKPIPFFTQNTIPVKVADLIDCLLIDESTVSVYDVPINIEDIDSFVCDLKYLVSEAKRCTVQVSFNKSSFEDIDFSSIKLFDGSKDEIFKLFLQKYIEDKISILNKYIGSIRDGLKGKAILLDNNSQTITLQYKAAITADKKKLIIENLKD